MDSCEPASPHFSLLDKFPATPNGHVEFLEMVCDKVHETANALRHGYPSELLIDLVRGIQWEEARRRVSELTNVPTDVAEMIADVLKERLSLDTIEELDEAVVRPFRLLKLISESESPSSDELVEEEPPELIRLRQWLALDGVKGFWGHTIAAAEFWHLEVDARHRNIAFLLRQVLGGDPPEDAIRDYLFRAHGIVPSDPVDLATLEQLLRQDAERVRASNPDENETNHSASIERSIAGWMGDVELAATLGVHSSQIKAFRAKLKRMRDNGELSTDDWREVENQKRNEPQFLYRADTPAIVRVAERYKLPTSS